MIKIPEKYAELREVFGLDVVTNLVFVEMRQDGLIPMNAKPEQHYGQPMQRYFTPQYQEELARYQNAEMTSWV